MKAVRAIYEHGVFRPLEPVELPEASEVMLETKAVAPEISTAGRRRIFEVLAQRFDSGETDTAERHDEHQP